MQEPQQSHLPPDPQELETDESPMLELTLEEVSQAWDHLSRLHKTFNNPLQAMFLSLQLPGKLRQLTLPEWKALDQMLESELRLKNRLGVH